jgi:hypothetical protein
MSEKTYLWEIYSSFAKKVKRYLGKFWIFYVIANFLGIFIYWGIQTERMGQTTATENLIDALIFSISITVVLLIFLPPYIRFWVIPLEIYNEKNAKLDELKSELEKNRKAVKLNLETKVDNFGTIIDLDIRNKSNKDINDCLVNLTKLTTCYRGKETVVFQANKKKPFHLRWKTVNFEDKKDVWGKIFFDEEEPVLEKKIPYHETENVILFQINQGDWDNASFSIEFHSCEIDVCSIKSKKTNTNRSVIEVDILLELSFDFEDETITRQYIQKITLAKKIIPINHEGKIGYEPPKINYQFSEWIYKNGTEN